MKKIHITLFSKDDNQKLSDLHPNDYAVIVHNDNNPVRQLYIHDTQTEIDDYPHMAMSFSLSPRQLLSHLWSESLWNEVDSSGE